MLSERHCRLLTAFIDGQLGPRQREAVLRLLHRSSEARKLLRQLQEDAHVLHELPRQALPADFSSQVMRVAAERGLRPGGARLLPRPRGLPAWAGLAAAASVLLAVVAGSFAFFRDAQAPREAIAIGPPNLPKFDLPPLPERIDLPKEIGFRVALNALHQPGVRTRLEKELRKEPAHHLDLATVDTSRTVARLEAAFRKNGVQFHVDKRARVSLKKKQPKTTYVVYAENLRPEELTAILQQVGHGNAGDPALRRGAGSRESVLLNPMSAEDRTDLAKLLGVPPAQLEPRRPPMTLLDPIVVPKDKQGKDHGRPRPAPKETRGFAVVLAQNGADNTAEVRRFLNSRPAPRPGTVQVYLVLHEASA